MNFTALPDFLAIGGLVLAFAALLRRARQTRLQYWLVGWVLLLVHILGQFISQNTDDPVSTIALTLAVAMLLYACAAFIWASQDSRRQLRWHGLLQAMLTVTPDALMYAAVIYAMAQVWIYAALTIAGLVTALIWYRDGRRHDERRKRGLQAAALIGAYGVQAVLLARGKGDYAINWSLFWHYLVAALYFRMSSDHKGVGVRFTTWSFVAWALVFPVSVIMDMMWPHAHVDNEVWNLPKFLVATGLIFTLLEEQMAQSEYAALHDDLTGLPNRRQFMLSLREAVRAGNRMKAQPGVLALLVIDLDDFKRVNDTHGHVIGDALLRGIAQRFRGRLRKVDTLARLGGDEFAAILPCVPDRATAQRVVEKLHACLQEPFVFGDLQLRMEVSIGMAVCPEDATDEVRLYAFADHDMYRHKPDLRRVVAPGQMRLEPFDPGPIRG